MKSHAIARGLGFVMCVCALIVAAPASALFHFADIVEVFSNADGTIQYIEMRMTSNNQSFLSGHSFTSNVKTFNIPSNLPSTSTNGKAWLMATSRFSALPGAVTPDYIIPDNFFSINGDTLTFVGGAFAPMTFGPGDLPTDGVASINKSGAEATNTPENFNGDIGDINVPPLDPDDVYVDFEAGSNGTGGLGAPFDNLLDAVAAANASAIIHLEPGASSEIFAGGDAISKALTLQNDTPGDGPVTIGSPPARAPSASGFRSRPRRE